MPSLSLWFWLARVYFSWDGAEILPEAGWVRATCVQYVRTCLLSICSFGCIQYMCNVNTHAITVTPGCCTMRLWKGWEMDVVVLNFSANRYCIFVSSSEILGWDAPKHMFQWCRGPSGKHIFKCEMSTSGDLSAEYQMLMLLELLWTEKETHYIVLNKAEGSHEMLLVNMSKISPQTSVYQIWLMLRHKR